MGKDSRISATPPDFKTYLSPRLRIPFRRSKADSPSSHSPDSSPSTTPGTSPDTLSKSPRRLSRLGADVLRCTMCSTDFAFSDQIVSKGFTGRHGRGMLVSPLPDGGLANIRVHSREHRQLATGWHVVSDIRCETCGRKVGWKYVDASEKSQKYKVGKFILESTMVASYRCWGDTEDEGEMEKEDGVRRKEDVEFDSEDEDECEDIFAGVWDAEEVAERRNQVAGQPLVEDAGAYV